jgi:hypothetical protein
VANSLTVTGGEKRVGWFYLYWGKSARWGFELIYDPWMEALDIMLVHWYFSVEFVGKRDVVEEG